MNCSCLRKLSGATSCAVSSRTLEVSWRLSRPFWVGSLRRMLSMCWGSESSPFRISYCLMATTLRGPYMHCTRCYQISMPRHRTAGWMPFSSTRVSNLRLYGGFSTCRVFRLLNPRDYYRMKKCRPTAFAILPMSLRLTKTVYRNYSQPNASSVLAVEIFWFGTVVDRRI